MLEVDSAASTSIRQTGIHINAAAIGSKRTCSSAYVMSASLIGRLGSSAFQTSHYLGVDVARGLVLLFGIGTKALPVWVSKTRRNNLWGGLAVLQTVGPSGHTNSPHPSSREGHHPTARWSSSILLSRLMLMVLTRL